MENDKPQEAILLKTEELLKQMLVGNIKIVKGLNRMDKLQNNMAKDIKVIRTVMEKQVE